MELASLELASHRSYQSLVSGSKDLGGARHLGYGDARDRRYKRGLPRRSMTLSEESVQLLALADNASDHKLREVLHEAGTRHDGAPGRSHGAAGGSSLQAVVGPAAVRSLHSERQQPRRRRRRRQRQRRPGARSKTKGKAGAMGGQQRQSAPLHDGWPRSSATSGSVARRNTALGKLMIGPSGPGKQGPHPERRVVASTRTVVAIQVGNRM